jgi:hypothetical protein
MEQPLILRSAVMSSARRGRSTRRHGVTLLELLVATTLMLLIMGLLIYHVFGPVTEAVTRSRALLEKSSNLRVAVLILQDDLSMVTATTLPPLSHEEGLGYFEIIEGPVGPRVPTVDAAFDSMPGPGVSDRRDDTTVGDYDDILMFTAKSVDFSPFIGRGGVAGQTLESNEAEIIYFVRGTTLYRRVLLIVPRSELPIKHNGMGFYENYDASVALNDAGDIEANTLQDLTRPERRFAHRRSTESNRSFPNCPRLNLNDNSANWQWGILGLPTLCEGSHASWKAGGNMQHGSPGLTYYGGDDGVEGDPPAPVTFPDGSPLNRTDFWRNPHPYNRMSEITGVLGDYDGPRKTEDILMTDVIGFDIKVWDPTAPVYSQSSGSGNVAVYPGDPGYTGSGNEISRGAYVDLGYGIELGSPDLSTFSGHPDERSGLDTASKSGSIRNRIAVYDTWSTHYENDGLCVFGYDKKDNDGDDVIDNPEEALINIDKATNGLDDGGVAGLIDDAGERETMAPYEVRLRGIKITIRYFEPDSKQVRETSVYHSFVPN